VELAASNICGSRRFQLPGLGKRARRDLALPAIGVTE